MTAGGFVAAGADIVGVGVLDGLTHVESTAPGQWWTAFEGTRFTTGRGTSWTWWPRPADAGRIRLELRHSRLVRQ